MRTSGPCHVGHCHGVTATAGSAVVHVRPGPAGDGHTAETRAGPGVSVRRPASSTWSDPRPAAGRRSANRRCGRTRMAGAGHHGHAADHLRGLRDRARLPRPVVRGAAVSLSDAVLPGAGQAPLDAPPSGAGYGLWSPICRSCSWPAGSSATPVLQLGPPTETFNRSSEAGRR